MATSKRIRGLWWSRFHFLIRFLGLTGLLVAVAALTVAWRQGIVQGWPAIESWEQAKDQAGHSWSEITAAAEDLEWTEPKIVVTVLLAGIALTLLALVVELLAALAIVSGRRSAFGSNALVQVGLAVALLLAINFYSFYHYLRLDWTRDQQFTLSEDISKQLRQLRGDTHIVVYEKHKTFGQLTDEPDSYYSAAERTVIEKIDDLVELFRDFGPRFRVERIDTKDEEFSDKLEDLTRRIARESLAQAKRTEENKPATPSDEEVEEKAQELRAVMRAAPENSIFFFAGGKVQAMSFGDFLQLDRLTSQEQKNLVLLKRDVRTFANKVLNVESKRPKIGIAVTHEWLTTEGAEEYSLRGLRKALKARGFDVRDIILKRWSRFSGPEPAVYTIEESKLDRLDERLTVLDAVLKVQEGDRKDIEKIRDQWKRATLEQLTKDFAKQLRVTKITQPIRESVLEQLNDQLEDVANALSENRKRRDSTRDERGQLNAEQLAEQHRFADTRGKMSQLLADCDVLLIPRMTIRNVNIDGDTVPMRIHRLEDDAQVEAIKDFMKAGKPVLACFGPINEPSGRFNPADASGPDKLEDVLAQLGFHLGKQTVLFDSESESFAEQRVNPLATGANVVVPPLQFDWKPGAGLPAFLRVSAADRTHNRLQESIRIVADSMGKDPEGKASLFDLRIRHPRPVYFEPRGDARLTTDPYFLMTSAASWNDDQPFPTSNRTPQFERGKSDPDKGTLDERRRGPFPIGAAAQVTLPSSWYDSKSTPAQVRVAAIGNGGFFAGADLSPAKETLMLDTINWLLGRDEYLPKADQQWSYPRVELSERDKELWHWGTQIGLPAVFLYTGLIVLLVRRVR